jgi:uncharacterized protein YdhG (YjbR/CyaY superfamily)
MKTATTPATIDEYIAGFPADVRRMLTRIRKTIRAAAPEAEERISYRMPAFKLKRDIAYFAAFKNHIGFYQPVRGDAALEKAVAKYAGEKGNLRFPIDEPIPYDLIARIVAARVKQQRGATSRKKTSRPAAN